MPGLDIRLLGAPRIAVDGTPIAVDTRKAIALLAYLAVVPGPVSREVLAALLWPESDGEDGRAALRRTLSTLRSALRGRWIGADRNIVLLEAEGVECDIARFRRLLAESRAHEREHSVACGECLDRLSEAADLYRGDFMAGFTLRDSPEFDDWQAQQAEQFRREFDGALAQLVRPHEARGDLKPAVAAGLRRIALDALNEAAHCDVMRLLALAGDRSGALRQYRECVRVLDQELGVQPLESTTDLYRRISEGTLTAPEPEPVALGVGTSSVAHQTLPFVGRSAELDVLPRLLQGAATRGHLLILEGEAGIGKTRLLAELLTAARARGSRAVLARCFEGEASLAYEAFVELLHDAVALPEAEGRLAELPVATVAEASRLLPDLASRSPGRASRPGSLETPGARVRFFQGVIDVIAACARGEVPGVVAVDDAGWADEASQELLGFLCRRLDAWPLLIIVTWRPEAVPPGHRLRGVLAGVQKDGDATSLGLPRLSASDVDSLLQAAVPDNLDTSLSARLYGETEGLPLFIAEYLVALQEAGSTEADWSVPAGIQELLRDRVSRLSATSRQLLTAAATLGRDFGFDLLQEVSGRSEEEALAGLDDLRSQCLVEELSGEPGSAFATYDFCHERLRALVYEDAGLARRRLLHRRAAQALVRAQRLRRDGGAMAGVIANHLRLAGDESEAARYYRFAGDHARSLHANAEAQAHYETALALVHPEQAALNEALGDLRTLAGDYGAAVVRYETAAALADAANLPALERKLGNVYQRGGEWEMAERHLESALAGFEEASAPGDEARVLADLSLIGYRRGDPRRARELSDRALELAERGGDGEAIAQAHNSLGILARGNGDDEESEDHFRHSLRLAEQRGDGAGRLAALNNLALVLLDRDDAEALTMAQAALELCIVLGDRHCEAAIRNNLADIHHRAGQTEEAMAQLKQAVTIFAEVGLSPDTVEPEIWKLYEW